MVVLLGAPTSAGNFTGGAQADAHTGGSEKTHGSTQDAVDDSVDVRSSQVRVQHMLADLPHESAIRTTKLRISNALCVDKSVEIPLFEEFSGASREQLLGKSIAHLCPSACAFGSGNPQRLRNSN